MVVMMGYRYEKNAETQDKNRETNLLMQFAEDLFDMWDPDRDGYLFADKLADCVLSLGLAKNKEFMYRLLAITLRRPLNTLPKEKVTKEEFHKLTHSSRFVNRILKILNQATKSMLQEKKRASSVLLRNKQQQ